ncbi:rho GTPase-activating protein 6-like [Chenopodium quinoa]|uniref:rho GTPase-activating protein 6-like n=1 Tax=Chenopodium quinoa TaxID=63459 RepID=UPI000B786838|nr:rho GTPase-activating protein 6-like [Chenopodium quinoa]
MGHNGIFRNDTSDAIDGSFNQWRDKRPVKSLVVGQPILLALEDIDGGPSFLEKLFDFLKLMGIKWKEFYDSLQMLKRWSAESRIMNKVHFWFILSFFLLTTKVVNNKIKKLIL